MRAAIAQDRLFRTAPVIEEPVNAKDAGIRWYEQWVPLWMIHQRGHKIGWWPWTIMQTLRFVHFAFFNRQFMADAKQSHA